MLVGINLNKKSYYKTAFNTMKLMAEQMHNKAFSKIKRSWNSACGIHNGGDRIWIIDIDKEDLDESNLFKIKNFIENAPPKRKIIAKIPSKTGFHWITHPFDIRGFEIFNLDLHKNNPTNLYIP